MDFREYLCQAIERIGQKLTYFSYTSRHCTCRVPLRDILYFDKNLPTFLIQADIVRAGFLFGIFCILKAEEDRSAFIPLKGKLFFIKGWTV